MKALSIRNPFAHQIMCGEKEIECRSWQTSYRGDILICSSASPKIEGTISGHALCIARLDSIEPFTRKHLKKACLDYMPEKECYAWHLTNIRVIKPFAVKGFYITCDIMFVIVWHNGSLSWNITRQV